MLGVHVTKGHTGGLGPQVGLPEQGGDPLHHPCVGAIVAVQREVVVRTPGGRKVCVQVGAAEPVDRLAWVPDHDEPGAPVEGVLEDLPLGGTGVLEFINHHQVVACRQDARGELPGDGIGQGHEYSLHHVVVAVHRAAALAGLELAPQVGGELDATDCVGAGARRSVQEGKVRM